MRHLKHPVVLAASFLAAVIVLRYFEYYSVLQVIQQIASWALVVLVGVVIYAYRMEIAEFLDRLAQSEKQETGRRLQQPLQNTTSEPGFLDRHPGIQAALAIGAIIFMICIWRWSVGLPIPGVEEYNQARENPVTWALIGMLQDSWLLIVICVGVLILACSGNTSVGTAHMLFTLAIIGLSFLAMYAIVVATIAKFKAGMM